MQRISILVLCRIPLFFLVYYSLHIYCYPIYGVLASVCLSPNATSLRCGLGDAARASLCCSPSICICCFCPGTSVHSASFRIICAIYLRSRVYQTSLGCVSTRRVCRPSATMDGEDFWTQENTLLLARVSRNVTNSPFNDLKRGVVSRNGGL